MSKTKGDKFLAWTMEKINALGEWVEYEYEVEYDFTPGEEDYISGPPEKCYQGNAEEFDVIDIYLCRDGQRIKLDPKNWEAAGFHGNVFDKMADEVREIFSECDEPDPPEPMDRD